MNKGSKREKQSISAVILTRNEEEMIADAIDSVSFCNEVILIDNNSTDKTVDIAERMGAKVYSSNVSSFAERRNIGYKKSKFDWILYLDADERADRDLVESIKYKVLSTKEVKEQAFAIRRKNYYLGNHEWPEIEKLERLFARKQFKEWRGALHETPVFNGELGELDGFLNHYSHRDLSSMVKKTIIWSSVEANLRYDANHPKMALWRFVRVMGTAFGNSFFKQKGYRVGAVGLIESTFQMFSMFITYAKLWEMQETNN